MHPEQAKPVSQPEQKEIAFCGELQRFTDPPLDDPEVRARQRFRLPPDSRMAELLDDKRTLPTK